MWTFDNISHNLTDLFSSYGHCKSILNIQIDHYATKRTYDGVGELFTNNALFLALIICIFLILIINSVWQELELNFVVCA